MKLERCTYHVSSFALHFSINRNRVQSKVRLFYCSYLTENKTRKSPLNWVLQPVSKNPFWKTFLYFYFDFVFYFFPPPFSQLRPSKVKVCFHLGIFFSLNLKICFWYLLSIDGTKQKFLVYLFIYFYFVHSNNILVSYYVTILNLVPFLNSGSKLKRVLYMETISCFLFWVIFRFITAMPRVSKRKFSLMQVLFLVLWFFFFFSVQIVFNSWFIFPFWVLMQSFQ